MSKFLITLEPPQVTNPLPSTWVSTSASTEVVEATDYRVTKDGELELGKYANENRHPEQFHVTKTYARGKWISIEKINE